MTKFLLLFFFSLGWSGLVELFLFKKTKKLTRFELGRKQTLFEPAGFLLDYAHSIQIMFCYLVNLAFWFLLWLMCFAWFILLELLFVYFDLFFLLQYSGFRLCSRVIGLDYRLASYFFMTVGSILHLLSWNHILCYPAELWILKSSWHYPL